jgi:hypothetical protein
MTLPPNHQLPGLARLHRHDKATLKSNPNENIDNGIIFFTAYILCLIFVALKMGNFLVFALYAHDADAPPSG